MNNSLEFREEIPLMDYLISYELVKYSYSFEDMKKIYEKIKENYTFENKCLNYISRNTNNSFVRKRTII